MKTYIFDIDGTICNNTEGKNDYRDCEPFIKRIEFINKLYDNGNKIYFQTARGMGRNDNDAKRAHEMFYNFTSKQLNDWNVKYHGLFLGKPSGDFYIDDKGINDEDFFNTTD